MDGHPGHVHARFQLAPGEEHLAAKREAADLLEMEPADEQVVPKMKELQELIDHRVEEEETELFPRVRQSFAREELESLGDQMEQMFDQLRESEPREVITSEPNLPAPLS